jgi:hypothetical protein
VLLQLLVPIFYRAHVRAALVTPRISRPGNAITVRANATWAISCQFGVAADGPPHVLTTIPHPERRLGRISSNTARSGALATMASPEFSVASIQAHAQQTQNKPRASWMLTIDPPELTPRAWGYKTISLRGRLSHSRIRCQERDSVLIETTSCGVACVCWCGWSSGAACPRRGGYGWSWELTARAPPHRSDVRPPPHPLPYPPLHEATVGESFWALCRDDRARLVLLRRVS